MNKHLPVLITLLTFGGVELMANTKPVINSSSFSVKENVLKIGTLDATDADGDTLTYYVYGTDAITIGKKSGLLKFTAKPDFESKRSYSFRAYASDGQKTVSKRIRVKVQNVNEQPYLTKTTYKAYQGRSTKMRLKAMDPEGKALSYSLAGEDAGHFQVSRKGVVTFRSEPNVSEKTTYNLKAVLYDGKNTARSDFRVNLITEFLYVNATIEDFTNYNEIAWARNHLSINDSDDRLAFSMKSFDESEGWDNGSIYLYHKHKNSWNLKETIPPGDSEYLEHIKLSNSGDFLSFSSFTALAYSPGGKCETIPKVDYTVWSFEQVINKWKKYRSFSSNAQYGSRGSQSITEDGKYIAYWHLTEDDWDTSGGCNQIGAGKILIKNIKSGAQIGNMIKLDAKSTFQKLILIDEKTLLTGHDMTDAVGDEDDDGCSDQFLTVYRLNKRDKWKISSRVNLDGAAGGCFVWLDSYINPERTRMLSVTYPLDSVNSNDTNHHFMFHKLTARGEIKDDTKNNNFEIFNGSRVSNTVGRYFGINASWDTIAYTAHARENPRENDAYITTLKRDNNGEWKRYADYKCFAQVGASWNYNRCGEQFSIGDNEIPYMSYGRSGDDLFNIPKVTLLKVN